MDQGFPTETLSYWPSGPTIGVPYRRIRKFHSSIHVLDWEASSAFGNLAGSSEVSRRSFPPMAQIPDITETEQWVMKTTLRERYGRDMDIQLADADIRLHASDRELTSCPVIYWAADDGCNFVVFKTGERSYRCQFFYKPYKQMGTGIEAYDDLTECAVSLLQAQADYVAEERGDLPNR
jgi:hypothetical protein